MAKGHGRRRGDVPEEGEEMQEMQAEKQVDPSREEVLVDPSEEADFLKEQAQLESALKKGLPIPNVNIESIVGFGKDEIQRMETFSELSYYPKDVSREVFPSKEELEAQGYKMEYLSDEKTDTHCTIITKDGSDEVYISFRGTNSKKNARTDIKADFTSIDGGHAHHGFSTAYQSIQPQIQAFLEKHAEANGKKAGDYNMSCTGHSLGGALATLCAMDLEQKEYNISKRPLRNVDLVIFN